MIDCSNCAYSGRPLYDYPCNVCVECHFWEKVREEKEKPMTNADRIRAMSDEELAEYIYKHFNQDYNAETFLEWLQETMEE